MKDGENKKILARLGIIFCWISHVYSILTSMINNQTSKTGAYAVYVFIFITACMCHAHEICSDGKCKCKKGYKKSKATKGKCIRGEPRIDKTGPR